MSYVRNIRSKNKGFTLIELIIVIAILAILVGLLAPQYIKYVEKSRKSTDVSNLEQLVKAVEVAVADPDYNISSGAYSIAIMPDYTRIFIDTKDGNASSTQNVKKLVEAIEEYTGYTFTYNIGSEYICKELKLKSNRWETQLYGNIFPMIITYLQVTKDSKITVTYDPSSVKDLISEK